jgi:hypothetical protein
MTRIGAIAVAAVALTAAAPRAEAQLIGIPNYPVETGTAIHVQADYAKPESGGSAYGVMGGVGFSRWGLQAAVGGVDAGGNSEVSYGAAVGMRLFGGGLNPLSVGAQVGASQVNFPIAGKTTVIWPGAYIKFSPPLFPIKPFGQAYYQTGNGGVKDEVRFMAGANLSLLLGFGFHAAYDWGDSGHTWGVGAHFTFRLPGVPGI